MSCSDFEIDQDDELLMHTYATLPTNCKKYWKKRYLLFSKFDEGVYLTSELWYSVTPEVTARVIAKIVKNILPDSQYILDVCCGGGGNSIQFAQIFRHVVAVDINANNVKCCQQNSMVYGADLNTSFVLGDWNSLSETSDWVPEIVPNKKFDFAFCSPPWGGPKYKYQDTFDLEAMEPFNLYLLCLSMSKFTENFGLFLPRNLDFDQIREVTRKLFGLRFKTRIVCIWQNERPLGIMAIFGPSFHSHI
ncbi:S-adenosyl-L-methionine-dependent methyltransferase [Metschnikowia bicuspidata var. bicuspidata NRRL YB-4993]|uniref:Trimethylguanosine synthase n=1 Tax=Metschnikowia bicuspidata var. bicuspidata NRRL YB-4993 TaxID=869754 RepID=A0A1A0H541_9ASCO|nr:S-adenosyl-L-methionine-dependent methyltransferase [Metschnikowia bicuspidata var. bicuspidata NRRL YB-4993]OBA19156.1 S-adenosyl-L-methionine-dependent methyltransferase [Metschnikowia bicuspidata var. bicuspidata NRRL YB-4993]